MRKCLSFLILWCFPLLAGWNEDFDAESYRLVQLFPEFKKGWYPEYYDFFSKIRKSLLEDSALCKRYKESTREDKFQICDKSRGVVIKKRLRQRIQELYVWELSCILGTSDFVVPSFPVEIEGTKVVLQVIEEFAIGRGEKKIPPLSFVEKVPLVDYWKSHLMAYILGLGDLVGINIGVNTFGKIRFFDTESCLHYQNEPSLSEKYFKTGFVMESFEWPHYREPLSTFDAYMIGEFIRSLAYFEEKLSSYTACRSISLGEGIHYRLDRIRSFPLQAGKSFRDFYGFLFPRMNEGLDELNALVTKITKRQVDHGAAILFASRRQERYKMSKTNRQMLQEWIDTYVGGHL
ncbi:MAG: hypothetical protein FJZ58_00675 [Chlamydiae bacterium]|nr:hypothetical protein [Chlamydiota bacterium]